MNHDIDNAQLTFIKKEYQTSSNIKTNDNNTNNCNNHDEIHMNQLLKCKLYYMNKILFL